MHAYNYELVDISTKSTAENDLRAEEFTSIAKERL